MVQGSETLLNLTIDDRTSTKWSAPKSTEFVAFELSGHGTLVLQRVFIGPLIQQLVTVVPEHLQRNIHRRFPDRTIIKHESLAMSEGAKRRRDSEDAAPAAPAPAKPRFSVSASDFVPPHYAELVRISKVFEEFDFMKLGGLLAKNRVASVQPAIKVCTSPRR